MTPEEFRDWRKGMDLTQEEAAKVLELSRATVQAYERKRAPIPLVVAYACGFLMIVKLKRICQCV